MSRMSSLLILIAMVVTAGSVATVLDMRFGLPLGQALLLGLGLLLVLVLVPQHGPWPMAPACWPGGLAPQHDPWRPAWCWCWCPA